MHTQLNSTDKFIKPHFGIVLQVGLVVIFFLKFNLTGIPTEGLIGILLFLCLNFQNHTYTQKQYSYAFLLAFFAIVAIYLDAIVIRYGILVLSLLSINGLLGLKNTWPKTFLLLFSSSLFKYVAEVYTFPIRMKLGNWVGKIMRLIDPTIQIDGNTIHMGNHSFAVDQACVGLDMLTYSLIFTTFLIAIFTKKVTFSKILFSCFIAFSLNIIGNLMRIISLIIFKVPENSIGHELIGILSFLVYVCLPLYGYFSRKTISSPFQQPIGLKSTWLETSSILSVVLLFFVGIISSPTKKLSGESSEIVQVKNPHSLIYKKPLQHFLAVEHSPTICWKGSGYEFFNIEETNHQGVLIYVAELRKNKDVLYTAWWFSDDLTHTNSQFIWRWNALFKNKKFELINITTEEKPTLYSEIDKVIF
ncbi:MAG: exosortase N [Leadbetterella sp.]